MIALVWIKKVSLPLHLRESTYKACFLMEQVGIIEIPKLVEPTPKVLYVTMPVVHVYAINTKGNKDLKLYECPVYKKLCLTDLTYITALYLKTSQNPDHWILRGAALLWDILSILFGQHTGFFYKFKLLG